MDVPDGIDARERVLEREIATKVQDLRLVELRERRRDLETMAHGGVNESLDVAEELSAAVGAKVADAVLAFFASRP